MFYLQLEITRKAFQIRQRSVKSEVNQLLFSFFNELLLNLIYTIFNSLTTNWDESHFVTSNLVGLYVLLHGENNQTQPILCDLCLAFLFQENKEQRCLRKEYK